MRNPPKPSFNLPVYVIDRPTNPWKTSPTIPPTQLKIEIFVRPHGQQRPQFSSYEFDLGTGYLTRHGIRLRLEGQPAKVLELLIQADGGLVSRRELIAALWPGEAQGDFDRRLDKAVAKLRASLNDDPAKPRFVETLKGRGYRFIDKVTFETTDSVEENPAETKDAIPTSQPVPEQSVTSNDIDPAPRRNRFKQRFFVWSFRVVASSAAVVVAVLLLGWKLNRRIAAPSNRVPSILILDFRDTSNSTGDLWLSRSVSEWLSTDLRSGGDLQILHGTDSAELRIRQGEQGCRDLPQSMLDVARRAFNADFVLYGDYSSKDDVLPGDEWRLDVCLVNIRDHKGAESVSVIGTKGDVAQLVSRAGELLRARLELQQLSSQSLGYLRATLPTNLTAARLYAEGASALEHFEPKEASVLLTEAARIEPQHAPTHAALSNAWNALGYQEKSKQEASLARDLAKNLSPSQQLEYAGLADEASGDWVSASGRYSKLIQLHPDNIEYSLKLAHAQTQAGRSQLALETLRAIGNRNRSALVDPCVDLAEATADSALSDFRGELKASAMAELHAEAQGTELMVADARMEEGDAQDALDHWSEAQRLWRSASQAYESIGDYGGKVNALNHQAALAWHKEDTANAIKLFEEGMKLSKAIGDDAGVAYSLSRLGDLLLYAGPKLGGDSSTALRMFRQSEAIYKTLGNLSEEGNVLSLFGDEAARRTRYEEAKGFYTRAMALSRAANDKSRVANRLLDIGRVTEAEGDPEGARRLFVQSELAYEALGQEDRAAIARESIALVLLREGRLDDAAPILEASIAKLKSVGRTLQVLQARQQLTMLELVQNPARAETLANENAEESKGKSAMNPLGAMVCYAYLAEAESKLGKSKDAEQSIKMAFATGESAIPAGFLPELLLARGDVRMNAGNLFGAGADFQRSRKLAHDQRRVYWELESRLALAELHSFQQRKIAVSEMNLLEGEAKHLGYGIIPLKINEFIRDYSPQPQPMKIALSQDGPKTAVQPD